MNTEQMREALIRRMDAYLSGQSTEATAIIKDARAALTHPQEPARVGGVPEGWKLVPVEPTWDMKMAASSSYREPRDGHYTARMECAAEAYRAMLTAAPQAPADVRVNLTDEQIKSAINVWFEAGITDVATFEKRMRAAIDAAMSTKAGGV